MIIDQKIMNYTKKWTKVAVVVKVTGVLLKVSLLSSLLLAKLKSSANKIPITILTNKESLILYPVITSKSKLQYIYYWM